MSREELEIQAKELDLKVDGRWSDERLAEEIEAAINTEETEVEAEVEFIKVKNMHNGPWVVDGIEIASGEDVEIDTSSAQAKASINSGFLKVC